MFPSNKVIINFAPTGMVPTKNMTPHVPISVDEIIEDVSKAYELWITIAHLHAREENEEPAYEKEIYKDIIDGIKARCPWLVICVSLSWRKYHELRQRTQVLELYPDMASLTANSLNFKNQASTNSPEMIEQIIERIHEFGVIPEIEIFDQGTLNYVLYLIKKWTLKAPFYFNVIVWNIASMQLDLASIGVLSHSLPSWCFWTIGWMGTTQRKANVLGCQFAHWCRIWIEDNIYFDEDRTILATNQDLLERIHQFVRLSWKTVMTWYELQEYGFKNYKHASWNVS